MANLDVALRLRLLNGLKPGAAEAKRDLDGIREAAQRLNGVKGGDALARDLTKVAVAGGRADAAIRRVAADGAALSASGAAAGRLGGQLTGVASAGGRADAAIRRVAADGAALSASGAAAGRLGGQLTSVASAGGRADAAIRKVAGGAAAFFSIAGAAGQLGGRLGTVASAGARADAALRGIANSRAGLAGLDAVAKALAADLDKVAAAGRRAASPIPRVQLAPPTAPPPAPWGARPTDRPSSAASPSRPPPPTGGRLTASPEDPKKDASGSSTILATGATALKAAGGIYVARAAIRATVGEAIGFEKAWAEVIKKVNDAPNPAAMQQLQRTIAKTSIDLGLPRQGLAELTAEAGAAGIKFNELERYVRLAAKASIGWDMTPRDASQKLAEIKTAGQYTIAEMDVLADKINALGDNSAAKESDIVEMMQRAAAPAKAAGVDTDTSLAALTALRSGGMQADIASRFFGAFTSKLATASADGKKGKGIQEAFELLGLTVKKVADGMKRDAGGTMIDILDRLAKHAEPAKVATKLMGQEWWDELARFSQSVPEFKKQLAFLKDPSNFGGSLGGNLNVQLGTTANHLERLKSLTGDIGDRMGRWALPGINKAIEGTIRQFDELERRRALAKASDPDKDDSTPIGRVVTKALEVAPDVYRKGLDLAVGELPTVDPARERLERSARIRQDAKDAADKARAEAEALEVRAKSSKDKAVRAPLQDKAREARARAAEQDAVVTQTAREMGPSGARDMTDVEYGEAAARISIETRRQIRQHEEALRGKGANVRLPGTGIITSRQGAEAELKRLRARMQELTAGPDLMQYPARPNFDLKGPAPTAPLTIDRAPGTATKFPMVASLSKSGFDPQPIVVGVQQAEEAAKGLQTSLKQDLSAPATESMQTYSSALQSGIAAALATVVSAAAQMKSALSFTATPTIAPRISAPSGGGGAPAGGGAAPASGSGGSSPAPRVQSAALRRGGGGGPTFTGPIHVHGVRDVASLQRGIQREADRRARDARDGALHDTGSEAA